jgi:hypothetical protein
MTWMPIILRTVAALLVGMLWGGLIVHHYSQCFCPTF